MGHPSRYEQRALSVEKDSFCSNPVAKGKVEFPNSIGGRAKQNFDMYSGYVNVTDAPDYLFYWFFGTQVFILECFSICQSLK